MDTPGWALTLAYWLHMLATVVWIGGMAVLALFVLPASRRALPAEDYATLLGELRRRLDPWGWFSLVILLATGMVQMSASPFYSGFLAIDNRWAVAILLKHILFLAMAGLSAYMTWGILPRFQRLALRRAGAGPEAKTKDIQKLIKEEALLLRVNLALGVLILALTAIARAA
jgi:uncharacterized membrane protein